MVKDDIFLTDNERLERWYNDYVRGANVRIHLNYFDRQGLTTEEADVVYEFLVKLGERTGNMWVPRDCDNIPDLTKLANRIYRKCRIKDHFKPLVPRRYNHSHFFWASRSHNGDRQLIIDPTGVPEYADDHSSIVPYFGLLGNARGFAGVVYQGMKPMDSWGTRDLPPGFHP